MLTITRQVVDGSLALRASPLAPGGDGRLAGGRVVGTVVEGLAGKLAQGLVGLFADDVYAGGAVGGDVGQKASGTGSFSVYVGVSWIIPRSTSRW